MTLNERDKELELFNAFLKKELPELFEKHSDGNFFAKVTYDSMFGAWLAAKAQAVAEKQSVTLTCAELKEAFDFGAPDGEKDQFQMETEMTITWLKDGYDGEGYYCWYADLPEEGCIKLGESKSGAEG